MTRQVYAEVPVCVEYARTPSVEHVLHRVSRGRLGGT